MRFSLLFGTVLLLLTFGFSQQQAQPPPGPPPYTTPPTFPEDHKCNLTKRLSRHRHCQPLKSSSRFKTISMPNPRSPIPTLASRLMRVRSY
jgi:hypothetical protein